MSSEAQALPGVKATSQTAATNWAPTAKVSLGALAAAITTIVFAYWQPPSASVAAALTTLITFVVQYVVPERQ